MSALQTAKFWLLQHLGLAKDALHIYVALTLFLGSAILFRWPLRSWKPWGVVAFAAVAGEIWDVYDTISQGMRVRPSANWHDIWNTLFWPTVLMLLARFTRVLKR